MPFTLLSTVNVSFEPWKRMGARLGPSALATSDAVRPGVHCAGQDATRASRVESTITRGCTVEVASSAFGKS